MNKFEDIRSVALNLDDTLVDSTPGLAAAADMALYMLELPAAGEECVTTRTGNGADVLMECALIWACQECVTQYRTTGKLPADGDILAEEQVRILRKLFDRYYGEAAEEEVFLPPHVANTLDALQTEGLPLGPVTNKPTPLVMLLLEALDVVEHFNVVIGGDDVQNKKPHPDLLLLVAEWMGTAPQQMLFVGDLHSDIQAAKAAGYPSVGSTYGYNYGEVIDLSQPDVIYQSINGLLPVLGLPYNENQESKND